MIEPVCWTAGSRWLESTKAKVAKIEFAYEHVNSTYRIVFSDITVTPLWKQR